MAKPMLIVALARSKTVRRLIVVLLALQVILIAGVVVPLVAVPAVLAAHGMVDTGANRPMIVGEWGYPLAGDYLKTSGFGWRSVEDCAFCSSDHKGYDMAQGCGATIYAAGPGTVIRAGAWGGYGNAVQIDHGGGVTSIYGHFLWGSLFVRVGQTVTAGVPLGLEGS
ncbi:MAG TPA: M23 family metallopeptidase, partial [Gemmatimonadales bacterium]|nr:M23 family metallopeptidase [Gemmatimonadales bacterium]